MIEAKTFKITKELNPEDVLNKFAALSAAYQCFFQVVGYSYKGDDDAIVGMDLLFKETLIELELLLHDGRYFEDNYIKKAELVK